MSGIPRIELAGLTRRLPSGGKILTILDGIDLRIGAGEFVAILGPSGSGKSTMLALMAGLDRPSSGRVLLDGEPIQELSEDALALLRRRKVGFVFQSFQLLGNLTARENILLPMELIGRRDARARAAALLGEVGLSERGHHYPSQLSGGEQQRVAVARAFAAEPSILLADEPTGNLDSATGRSLLDALARMRDRHGTTLVLVTHDPAVAATAERLVYLRDGRIEREEKGAARGAGAGTGGPEKAGAGPGAGAGGGGAPATVERAGRPAVAPGERSAEAAPAIEGTAAAFEGAAARTAHGTKSSGGADKP